MVDPITSKYFPHPADGSSSGGSDGNQTTYTADQVKNVTMGWNGWSAIPSFNLDPGTVGDTPGPSAPTDTPLNSTPLSINPVNMRSIERDILAATERSVEAYTTLKGQVESAISGGAIYGQVDTDQVYVDTTTVGGQSNGYWMDQASPLQQGAKDFAAKMDNYQRGALIGLANSLDVVGAYIEAINVAGTTYSYTDRQAKFPEPPAA